jgi:multidrug efflux pump subunit AcrB
VPQSIAQTTRRTRTSPLRATEDQGASPFDAAVTAARTRLRPILMTSLAFILGVLPLAIATGAGAEMRQSLGTRCSPACWG